MGGLYLAQFIWLIFITIFHTPLIDNVAKDYFGRNRWSLLV